MKRNRIIATIATAGLLFSACGGSGMGAQSGEETGGRSASLDGVQDGGTLHVLTFQEGASTLDPQRVYTGAELGAWGSTFTRTLTSYQPVAGEDGTNLVADMATDLGTASEDLKTWTFTLRAGLTWEDA